MIDHHARFGKLLRTPMVIATFAGFAFALAHPPMPGWLATAISMVGDALVPVMLHFAGRAPDARLRAATGVLARSAAPCAR